MKITSTEELIKENERLKKMVTELSKLHRNQQQPEREVNKFNETDVGKIMFAKITNVYADSMGIGIMFEHDGSLYQTRRFFSTYMETTGGWLYNPDKAKRTMEVFFKKFKVPFENRHLLIDTEILVEIKQFKGHVYPEIKPIK